MHNDSISRFVDNYIHDRYKACPLDIVIDITIEPSLYLVYSAHGRKFVDEYKYLFGYYNLELIMEEKSGGDDHDIWEKSHHFYKRKMTRKMDLTEHTIQVQVL